MGEEGVRETFFKKSRSADIAIIEGVMGLFDGRNDARATSSTAHIAMLLGLPVILVVDGSSMAQSAGAIVYGFENYMEGLQIAGVIFNNVAGATHYSMLSEAVKKRCKAEVLGYIPREHGISIPERHLGLVSFWEEKGLSEILERLAEFTSRHIDIERLVHVSVREKDQFTQGSSSPCVCTFPDPHVRVAVALDDAFWFYYQENLDILRDAGAELVFFSPLNDEELPPHTVGIYLGGGYPELYAGRLSENKAMCEAIRRWAIEGGAIYAECGGFMYLTEGIYDLKGNYYTMAGVYKTRTKIVGSRLRLGYKEVELLDRTILGKRGDTVRGHEFHYSELLWPPENVTTVYRLIDSKPEGYRVKNTLSSYIHIHFKSNDHIGESFVTFCKEQSG